MNNLEIKTKSIIKKYGIRANKRLGQNFLINESALNSIIEAGVVNKDDLIVEIGPGLGVLTAELCRNAGKVLAIELDRKFIDILKDVLADFDNYSIIHGDIMDLSLSPLLKEHSMKDVKVIANLPYYITTPVIMKLLEEETGFSSLVVMVQKEVAQRITAKPGGKEYGALTVAVNFYANPSIVADVPASSFLPQPKVDSSVIKIDIRSEPPVKVADKKQFFKVVRASFSQRRKTLLNSLFNSSLFGIDKETLKGILNSIGIDENRRPETLSIEEFANIAEKL